MPESESFALRPEQFHSPLAQPVVQLDTGEAGCDLRTVCGYWLYTACTGNQQAVDLSLGLIQQANAAIDALELLQRCQQGEDAAIQQAIALMSHQLTEQFEQAFSEHREKP